MTPELEKLIDLALADGVLTDKEKEVLYRKAKELNVDQDEFEMVLDAKLHLSSKATTVSLAPEQEKPKSQKYGDIRKCPSCGEAVKAISLNCSACGHEFTSIKGNASILDLLEKIDKIESKKNTAGAQLKTTQKFIQGQEFDERKDELIKNYPIPNTKEDILEFLTYSTSKLTNMSSLDNPWAAKADEIVMKSRFLFKNDQEMLAILDKYEKQIKKRKKGPIIVILVFFFILILSSTLVMIFGET